jgi:hypothetical protein
VKESKIPSNNTMKGVSEASDLLEELSVVLLTIILAAMHFRILQLQDMDIELYIITYCPVFLFFRSIRQNCITLGYSNSEK